MFLRLPSLTGVANNSRCPSAVVGAADSSEKIDAGSPANMKARFENQFARTLEDVLIARLEQTVRDVCALV